MMHVFFDCSFAQNYWRHVGFNYEMQCPHVAPDWLLQKINLASAEEIKLIARVIWGVLVFRKKKMWEGREVTRLIAM